MTVPVMYPARGKKAHEVCHILWLAIATDRDFVLRLPFAVFGRIVATDLFGVDAAWRDRVDGDPEFADLARQALGPGVDCGLGTEGAVDAFGLRLAGDVDDAPPLARHHRLEQGVGELALARKVERHGLVPLLFCGIDFEGAAATRVVDQDLDGAQTIDGRLDDARGSPLSHQVLRDEERLSAPGRADLACQLREQVFPPRHESQLHALPRQRMRDAATDADACARDQRRLALQHEFHVHPRLHVAEILWAPAR